jgi:Secretion system C-terminal sorting domain
MKQTILCALFVICGLSAQAQATAKGGDISVFPNPATEFIQVRDQSGNAQTVDVYTLVGRKVRSFEYNDGQQYGVSDLPRGLYLVQVVDRSGNVITTQKINKR